jgi:2-polyprenyl-3-methyl-5-hydroxy-6-metoxy-1,4-benzoquinol methylase
MTESSPLTEEELAARAKQRRLRILDITRSLRLRNHRPRRLLDVGSGNGAIAAAFSAQGVDVIGIDVVEEYVQKASARYPETKFLWYDGQHFPFTDASFDTVILNDVLEHISFDDIDTVISEVKRVLTPEGIVYISVMNRWQVIEPHKLIPFLTWLPRATWHPISRRIRRQDYLNYWPYTRRRLRKLLHRRGFEFQDVTTIYVQHKITGVSPIGDRMSARLIRLMRQLRLGGVAYYLGMKVSLLLFLAWKPDAG